jgi:hypothetical protein
MFYVQTSDLHYDAWQVYDSVRFVAHISSVLYSLKKLISQKPAVINVNHSVL